MLLFFAYYLQCFADNFVFFVDYLKVFIHIPEIPCDECF